MYVYVHVHVCMCVYVCMYVCMYVCINAHVWVYVYVCVVTSRSLVSSMVQQKAILNTRLMFRLVATRACRRDIFHMSTLALDIRNSSSPE